MQKIKNNLLIRAIKKDDDVGISKVILKVISEFGQSDSITLSIIPEVNYMFDFYTKPRHKYFVAKADEKIIGGAGIGPLKGIDSGDTCELQKMYIDSKFRGKGIGKQLLDLCLNSAKDFKYKACYLDTQDQMNRAIELYKRNGFKKLNSRVGNNNHHTCNEFYYKEL